MSVANGMDSVFAGCCNDESDFDVLFDREDSLIDTVNGVNESGDPLTGVDFADLHQTDDEATAKDVKEYDADDEKMGAPNPEGTKETEEPDNSVKGEVDKESEADKFIDSDTKEPEVKEDDDVTDNIEKVMESFEEESEYVKKEEKSDADKFIDSDTKEPEVKDGDDVTDNIEKVMESFEEGSKYVKEGCDVKDEIENEDEPVDEASADADVTKEVDVDYDEETEVLDAALGTNSSSDYSYDPSDEELIDDVMNN